MDNLPLHKKKNLPLSSKNSTYDPISSKKSFNVFTAMVFSYTMHVHCSNIDGNTGMETLALVSNDTDPRLYLEV